MRFLIRTRGISLLELLVVLALLAALFSLSGPSWRTLRARAESQSVLAGLERALGFARQEALLRQKKLRLCASSDQKHCSAAWQQGLLVLLEEAEESPVLRVFQWGQMAGTLHWRAFPRGREGCTFLPSGTTPHENGTFWYCQTSQIAWALMLGQAGAWRVRYPERDGSLRDERGLLLPCEGSRLYQHSFSWP